jgi:hypothetical protein
MVSDSDAQTLWLRIRDGAASAALKRGGVFVVHKSRAVRESERGIVLIHQVKRELANTPHEN